MSKHGIPTIRSESKSDRNSSFSTNPFIWKRKLVESSPSRGSVFSRLSPPNSKGHSPAQSDGNKTRRRSVFDRLGPVASVPTKLNKLDDSLDVKAGPSGVTAGHKHKTNGVHQAGLEVINNRLITTRVKVKGQEPNHSDIRKRLSTGSSQITYTECQETSFRQISFANETSNINYVYDIHEDFDYELDLVGSDSINGSPIIRDDLHVKRLETKSDNSLLDLIWENLSSWDVSSYRLSASEIPNNGRCMDTAKMSSEKNGSLTEKFDIETSYRWRCQAKHKEAKMYLFYKRLSHKTTTIFCLDIFLSRS